MNYLELKPHLLNEISHRVKGNLSPKAAENLIESFSMRILDVEDAYRRWVGIHLYELFSIYELVKAKAWEELENRYFKELEFGTGGLRARTVGHTVTRVEKNGVVAAVSGGFDPLHVGHLEYFAEVKSFADVLVVIVNQDTFLEQKKGYVVMPLEDRMQIVRALRVVDAAIPAKDTDLTVCQTLAEYADSINMFCKGGDRTSEEVPEKETCEKHDIFLVDGFGEKIRSSSKIVPSIPKPQQ
jgi:cytidyltransferase-like protein